MSTPDPKNQPQSPDAARKTVPPPSAGSSAETIQPQNSDSVSGSPMTSDIAVPGQLGRYRIESCLGQGAMGAVYKAHDTQLDRVVALKIPKFDASDAAMLERFNREAKAAATLSHPNICPVHDVGEIDGVHCISMGYIEGRPLSSFVNPDKPLSQKQAVQIVRKLAAGLNEAHSQGVVHRDLKPDNVMIDKKSNPVIMDFGLARRTTTDDIRVTQSGQMLGTPAYMSPEQVEGDVSLMGPRSDIYSLGVILYELLTGRLPYQGSVASVLAQIMKAEPQPPVEIRQNINPELQAICLKMMAANPNDRYSTVAEISRDLIALLKGKPTSVRDTVTGVASEGISTGDEGISQLVAAENHPLKDQIGERSRSNASKFRPVQGIVAAIVLVGLLAGYFLFVKVGDQTVRLKIDDPKAKVFVDGSEIRIMDLGATLQLKPGEHGIVVRRDDLIVETRSLTVVDGDNPVLQLDVLEPQEPKSPEPNPEPSAAVELAATKTDLNEPPPVTEPVKKATESSKAVSGNDPQAVFERLTSNAYVWMPPTKLDQAINLGSYNYAPWMSEDGLSLWYTANVGGNQGYDEIFVSRRSSLSADWESSENPGVPLNSPGKDSKATFTTDGCQAFLIRTGRIYTASRPNRNAPWSEPEVINGQGAVARSPVVSGDGRTLIVSLLGKTFDASLENSPEGSNEDIYQLTRDEPNGLWSEPQPMNGPLNSPGVDRPGWVSADGCVLLIESTREGGFGESDIWVAMRPSPQAPWKTPVNLGEEINSPENEFTPAFCVGDGTFAFSGKRPENRVFREIYVSRRVERSKSAAPTISDGTKVAAVPKTVEPTIPKSPSHTPVVPVIPERFSQSTDPVVQAAGWALSRQCKLVLNVGGDTVEANGFEDVPDESFGVTELLIAASHVSSPDNWHHLKAFAPTLKRLTVENASFNDAAMAQLNNANLLTSVTVHSGRLTEDGFKTLAKLPALAEVAIENSDDNGGQKINSASLKALADSGTLETLRISNVAVKDEWLQPIGDMPNLRTLTLNSTETTETGIAYLRRLKLTELDLSGNPLSDTVSLSLTEIKPLATLDLSHTEVGDPSCKQLVNLPRLRSLSLNATKVTNVGLTSLANLKRLQSLSLDQTEISNAGLSSLTKLRVLRDLSIKSTQCSLAGVDDFRKKNDKCQLAYSPAEDADLSSPPTSLPVAPVFTPVSLDDSIPEAFRKSELPIVRTVGWLISRNVHPVIYYRTATGSRSTSVNRYTDVPTVPFTVTHLSIQSSSILTKNDWEFLKGLPDITSINASIPAFNDDALKQLVGHPNLSTIYLRQTSISDEGLKVLVGIPKLSSLSITGNRGVTSLPDITDAAVPSILQFVGRLSSLTLNDTLITNTGFRKIVGGTGRLHSLNVSGDLINDDGISAIKGHPRLSHLFANGPGFSDATIAVAATLPQLSTLNLIETSITDGGLRAIAGHPRLSSVYLTGTAVTDNALLHLRQLSQLSNLSIGNTAISDAGLQVIAQLPRLRYVYLDGSKVTLPAAQGLQNARPNLRVYLQGVQRPSTN